MDYLPFILLALCFLSLWLMRKSIIWGTLLAGSLFFGYINEILAWPAPFFILALIAFWMWYSSLRKSPLRFGLFLFLIAYSLAIKLRLIPGFEAYKLTSKLYLGFTPLVGLFPLALTVPLSKKAKDWIKVFAIGLLFSVIGIGILAFFAIASGVVTWEFRLPSHPWVRYLSNFFLVAIPEEGFYRGFIQNGFKNFFKKIPGGKYLALLLSSGIFTFAHLYWSPDIGTFVFIFLAGLLYGFVYLVTEKIESAIICHFLLNFVHMTFFSYHAM